MTDASVAQIRLAKPDDLPAIVRMLADDHLGRGRERPGRAALRFVLTRIRSHRARRTRPIDRCRNHRWFGHCCLQLTIIPGLSHRGADRALIEDVRVDAAYRCGIGDAVLFSSLFTRHAKMRGSFMGCLVIVDAARWVAFSEGHRPCIRRRRPRPCRCRPPGFR
jgi:hypothetical protein